MMEKQRDAGLVRSIGPLGLAASIVGIVIGAGIFAAPGAMAASLGVYAPLALLICGVAVGAVAICFAEGGSRVPTSGGAYGYVAEAYGPMTGFVVGILLLLSDVLASGSVSAALGDVAASVAPSGVRTAVRVLVICAVTVGIALWNIAGVTRGTQLVKLTTLVKLLPLALFVCLGLASMHHANFIQAVPLSKQGLGHAFILGVFLLTGMEAAMSVSGEVREPARNIPRALLFALAPITLLYALIQLAAQGILGSALAQSSVPLADAMGRIHPALKVVMLAGAGLSMFGWLSSDILSSPRLLFAFARDGMLPKVLGRLHTRNHTPYVAILIYGAMSITLALTGSFAELAVLSTLAVAPLYMAGCMAAWKLKRESLAHAGEPLNFHWLGTAVVVGVVSMAGMIAFGSRGEILGLAAVIAVSVVFYVARTRWFPAR